ncbi:peptidylprolyl isomerase [Mangrovitalea sediminis]|uniref:peptidylprolyl isomerase n=1 Tax=Mangrovitalea sediminis TaxID=1982043 RepID=UPI000BE5EBD2|nr:peptidylprolyl isomerase [Mangrovitalea sediminis]
MKSRIQAVFGVIAMGLLLLSTSAAAEQKLLDRVVAVVNDGVILQSGLDARIQTVESRLNAQGTPLPPADILKKRVLDQLILDRIQLQMAEQAGLRVSDNELNDTMQNIAKRNGYTLDQFQQALASEGLTYKEAREQIRQEMLISRIEQRKVDPRVRITDREVQTYLTSQAGKQHTGEQYLIGHILISVNDFNNADQVAKAKQKAEDLLAQLKKGADFKQMAVANSDGSNALNGGVLGWRTQEQLPSLIAGVVPNMKVGDVSGLLQSPSGFHIIKLLDTRGGKQHIVEQYKVRHILIKPSEILTDAEAHQKIEDIYQRIKKGASFADLARQYSDDPVSGSDGGELGWVSPGEMVPEFEKVMDATPVGQLSKPFHSQFGWHILEVEATRKKDIGQQLQENEAHQILFRRKYEVELQNWLHEIRSEAFVEFKAPYDKLEKSS